jgi:diacylglycerol kinase
VSWRSWLRSRDFHALWIGAVLLALAIWFDVVWIAALVVFLVAAGVLFIEWLVSTWNPESRRRRRFRP